MTAGSRFSEIELQRVTPLRSPDAVADLPEPFARWFASRGWTPRAHQLELLAKARAGRSVLLIAPTGAGKTLAGFLPTLVELSATVQPAGRVAGKPSILSSPSLASGGGEARRKLISTGRFRSTSRATSKRRWWR